MSTESGAGPGGDSRRRDGQLGLESRPQKGLHGQSDEDQSGFQDQEEKRRRAGLSRSPQNTFLRAEIPIPVIDH